MKSRVSTCLSALWTKATCLLRTWALQNLFSRRGQSGKEQNKVPRELSAAWVMVEWKFGEQQKGCV